MFRIRDIETGLFLRKGYPSTWVEEKKGSVWKRKGDLSNAITQGSISFLEEAPEKYEIVEYAMEPISTETLTELNEKRLDRKKKRDDAAARAAAERKRERALQQYNEALQQYNEALEYLKSNPS